MSVAYSSHPMDRRCAVCGPVMGSVVLMRIPTLSASDKDSEIVCFNCARKLAFDSLEDKTDVVVPICVICHKACDITAGDVTPLKGSVMKDNDSHHAHVGCCRQRAYEALKASKT